MRTPISSQAKVLSPSSRWMTSCFFRRERRAGRCDISKVCFIKTYKIYHFLNDETNSVIERLFTLELAFARKAVFIALKMKTTIDLPEELLRTAKIHAAENQTTLKELVVKGLQVVTGGDAERKEAERQERIRKLLSDFQFENTEPIKPLTREECYDR